MQASTACGSCKGDEHMESSSAMPAWVWLKGFALTPAAVLVCCRPGNATGMCCSLFSIPQVMCNGAYFSLISGLLLCEPEAHSLPAAPEHKRQKFPKVSFVPHFCSENGNISWKIRPMKAMPFPKSTIYLLLIPPFFFFFLAEDPLSNTFFKGHF